MSIPNVTLSAGSGLKAINTILRMGNNGSPLVYNAVGNQAKIGNKFSTEKADTTNQGTVWDQSIPTRLMAGAMSVEIFYIPNSPGQEGTTGLVGHSLVSPGALGTVFRNQEVRPWSLTYPDGSGFFFEGYILDLPIEADPAGKALTIAMTIQITGEPVCF